MDDNPEPQAINAPAVEDNSVPTPPVEEPTTSEEPAPAGEAAEAQIEEPAAEAPESEPERKPTRAERRIHQLTDKIEQLSQPNQPGAGYGQSPQLPSYEGLDEVDPRQIQQDVVQTAQAIAGQTVNAVLAQERAKNNFSLDMQSLKDNPMIADLPEVEEAISEEFAERAIKVIGHDPLTGRPVEVLDPSVRLADIAKRHLKAAEAVAKRASADTGRAVAKTADEAAIRPGATPKSEKPFEELSIEEMEGKLGFVR